MSCTEGLDDLFHDGSVRIGEQLPDLDRGRVHQTPPLVLQQRARRFERVDGRHLAPTDAPLATVHRTLATASRNQEL